MSAQPQYSPRDYKVIPQGDGFIVKSATSDWGIGDRDLDRFAWFPDRTEAENAADYANKYVSTREIVGRTASRIFRGGR